MPIVADWRERRRRRRNQLLSAVLLLVAAGAMSLLQRREPPAKGGDATVDGPQVALPTDAGLTVIDGLPVVSLTGTPLDVGRRCGLLFKAELNACFNDLLVGRALPAAGLSLAQARELVPGLSADIPQTMVDLLQGLADSSGLSYNDVVLTHALAEFSPAPEFVGYGLLQPATRARDLLLAADWGVPAEAGVPKMAVMAVDAEGLGAWFGVGPAGLLAPWLAFNERGLAVALATTARDEQQAAPEGLPAALLALRILHDDTSIDDARQRIDKCNRTVPFELLLAQTTPKLDVAAVETTTGKLGFRSPTDGRLIATGLVRSLGKPPQDETYDVLNAWLEQHAGELNRRMRPFREADVSSQHSVLDAIVQPSTGTLGIVPATPATAAPTWLHWDSEAGTITDRGELSAGISP